MSQVKDLIEGVAHRLPSQKGIYPSINMAINMIAKRLFFHKSNIITEALSVSVAIDGTTGTLPSTFWGLMGRPYINGQTYSLRPLPNKEKKLEYSSTGIPEYYEVKGQTLHLTPGSSTAITINGDYFSMPTAVSKGTDTVPFYGMFDDAIAEFLILWYTQGTKADPNHMALIKDLIKTSVDDVAPYRDMTAPEEMPQGIDWADIMDEAME